MNIRNIDLNLLLTLDALLTQKSVSRAAAWLGLTQPAVSNALRRLREILSDPLLVRSGNMMVLTPRAQALAGPVHQTLADLDRTLFEADTLDPSKLEGPLIIGATDHVVGLLAAPLHRQLSQLGYGELIQFVNLDKDYVAGMLEDGRATLVISVIENAPESLRQVKLFEDSFTCAMRADHPAAAAPFDLEAYLSVEHILVAPFSGPPSGFVDRRLAEIGLKRRIGLVISSFHVACAIVAESDLVASLPTRIATAVGSRWQLALRSLPIEETRFAMRAFWHPRMEHAPAVRWLRDVVKDVCRTL